jgi:hypothetical protein
VENKPRGPIMKSLKEDQIIAGKEAVKKNLENDGWQILFENKDASNPLDIRAVRGNDVIVCHISYHSKGSEKDPELKKKLTDLKKRALKSNAFPFSAEVHYSDDGFVKEVLYNQII